MNYLDVNADGLVSKFADYTKITGVAYCGEGHQSMQRDIDQLQKLADK